MGDPRQSGGVQVEIGGDATVYGPVVGVNTGTITNIVQVAQVVTSLRQLRAPLADFVGRACEIETLLNALRGPAESTAALGAICGMGGLGKTELAIRVANALCDDYPDAQLFINLRSSTTGLPRVVADALRDAIRAFDPSTVLPDDIDALASRYRGLLGGKRVLVLLDDAPDDAAVRPLLPPAGCALLVTSRMRLSLGGQGTVLDLSLFSREESRALLLHDAPRLQGEPALDRLLDYCGDLPLAVRVAGATLAGNPALAPGRYLARLADETRRLGALKYEDTDVYAVLGAGDNLLQAANPALARRWRMLAVCPAPFDATVAASIWHETNQDAWDDALGQLVRRSLLRYDETTRQYHIHELLRDVARLRRLPEDDYTARLRHATHFLEIYREAQRLYEAGHDDVLRGLRLFDASAIHIRRAATWTMTTTTAETDRLLLSAVENSQIMELRLTPRERVAWFESVVAAARRAGDRRAESQVLRWQGDAHVVLEEIDRARMCYEQSLVLARQIGDKWEEIRALIGLSYMSNTAKEFHQTIHYCELARTIAREIGDRKGESRALINLGAAYQLLGDLRNAIKYYAQSLKIIRELGDQASEGIVLSNLGELYESQGDIRRAIASHKKSLAIARRLGDVEGEAIVCWDLGKILISQEQYARAAQLMRNRVEYERQSGHPDSEQHAAELDRMLEQARLAVK